MLELVHLLSKLHYRAQYDDQDLELGPLIIEKFLLLLLIVHALVVDLLLVKLVFVHLNVPSALLLVLLSVFRVESLLDVIFQISRVFVRAFLRKLAVLKVHD